MGVFPSRIRNKLYTDNIHVILMDQIKNSAHGKPECTGIIKLNGKFKKHEAVSILIPTMKMLEGCGWYVILFSDEIHKKKIIFRLSMFLAYPKFIVASDQPNVVYCSHATYKENECVICIDNKPNVIILPCYHQCVCENCYNSFKQCTLCPICQHTISHIRISYEDIDTYASLRSSCSD
jgi:hypothetical protein